MKIKELIIELQKYDPELDVVYFDHFIKETVNLDEVTLSGNRVYFS